MRIYWRTGLLLALLAGGVAAGEMLPTFHPAQSYRASHIVLVETLSAEQGKVRVLESWKGDLKGADTLTIPELAKHARGKMVLFLRRQDGGEGKAARWVAADFGKMRTSIAWIEGDRVSVVVQRISPGPATIAAPSWAKSQEDLKQAILYYVRTERRLAEARAIEDVAKRVAILAEIVNGRYDRKDEAFAELGKCGPKALPVLRRYLKLPPSHAQSRAIGAMVAAGGKDVLPEVIAMIEKELAYWMEITPTLKRGWWLNSSGEPSIRYGRLCSLVRTYYRHADPALRKQVVAVRDFFRAQPVFRNDSGYGKIDEYCDFALEGLSLGLTTSRPSPCVAGASFDLTVKLKNFVERDITVWLTPGHIEVHAEELDAEGNRASDTVLPTQADTGPEARAADIITLRPGDERKFSWDVTRKTPGTVRYTAQYRNHKKALTPEGRTKAVRGIWTGELTSNPVTIKFMRP